MFDHLISINYSEGATRKVVGRHFVVDITTKKIIDVIYWWPTLFKDIHEFCKSCDDY
jgi:hypothetical protein